MSKEAEDIVFQLEEAFSIVSGRLNEPQESEDELRRLICACQEFERIYQEWLESQNPFKCIEALRLLRASISK